MDRYALSLDEQKMVLDGSSRLTDKHIEKFHDMLRTNSEFDPRSTLYNQRIERIREHPRDKPHLQLLHSCENHRCLNCVGGHWICCYYDMDAIFIYDSLNNKKLHRVTETFLRKLFPFFDEVPKYFKRVQCQQNIYDCGVLSIVFATSVFFKKDLSLL